jgi:hypothetical protein
MGRNAMIRACRNRVAGMAAGFPSASAASQFSEVVQFDLHLGDPLELHLQVGDGARQERVMLLERRAQRAHFAPQRAVSIAADGGRSTGALPRA